MKEKRSIIMSKIKVMSDILANKIAAGEVVEKCASVVKELVENSIDADATDIKIELIDSGIKSIKVTDNGNGMDSEDALLAFSRHATSKLLKEDDLFFIDTLGFRGEALPSIASVSKVTLMTSTNEVGTQIKIEGGKLISNEKCAFNKGTSIEVSALFYNTPARLKYLKSETTELANTTSFIEKLSFAYPNIRFTLINNDKVIVKTSGSNDLLKTIHEVFGMQISSNMLEIKNSNDDFDIYGYVCKPQILKSNRSHMITIVNQRVVRNNDLNRAINDAYYTYKPDIKYPVVVLIINTDPTLIDVNIHPTKQDIKISKMQELNNLLINTIKDALYKNLLIPKIEVTPTTNDVKEEFVNNFIAKEETPIVKDEQAVFDLGVEENVNDTVVINEELKSLKLYPVGLALGTYIIAQNDEGVYLIDQHAAEERINYEKYLKALINEEISTTSLLFPISIELSPSDFIIIKENMEVLTNMGFKVEEFGVNTILIKEHPTWLKKGFEEEQIRKIIDLVIVNKNKFTRVKFNEHIAITLACKTSIKGNTNISMDSIEEILNSLVKCDNPYNCPHGRPTIIKFSIYELERMFKRVMN
jgi:DNA mismatch repair protein mutL